MLFGSVVGLRVEPVRKVGGSAFNGPNFDSVSNSIGSGTIQGLATTHLFDHVGKDGLGESLAHLFNSVNVLTKELSKLDEVVAGAA